VNALGERNDASAIPALEAMRRRTDLPVNFSNVIDRALDRLWNVDPESEPQQTTPAADDEVENAAGDREMLNRLRTVEQTLTEVNERLKRIEQGLPASTSP
jgi:hypothetical protein